MTSISLRHQILKTANFLQGENTQIFADKFRDKNPGLVKGLADRAYHLFKAWKDYDGYRALLASISDWKEMEIFIGVCEEKLTSLIGLVSGLGFPAAVADDMSRQYLHKYVKDLRGEDFLGRVSSANNKADFIALLRGEKVNKNALIPELTGKDLSALGPEHIDWVTKIIQSSKTGGEAHAVDDIISLAKTFRRMEPSFNRKIGGFGTYSELSKFIDDQSFDNKAAYVSSIRDAATSNDMSKVIYESPRWKVVLIGSTIGGQWWGRDTSFCISTLEENLYSSYALSRNLDPYFIIDKEADSSNEMRKFTVAIQYGEGKPKLNLKDPSTMVDANNVGISFGQIKTHLGSDANVVLDAILADAATRNESAGKKNSQRILSLIMEEDGDEHIIKYEKEIATNKDLARAVIARVKTEEELQRLGRTLKGIAMNNSTLFIEEGKSKPILKPFFSIAVKSLLDEKPAYILNYASEPWAKPYLDLAAKGLAEKDPAYILNYASEPWAKPYLDLAAKGVLEKNPEYILNNDSKPWAEPYLDLAAKVVAEKNPAYILRYASKHWAEPHLDLAAKVVAEKNPAYILRYASKPWVKPYLDLAAKVVAEENPEDILYYDSNYASEPWVKPYLDLAAKVVLEKNPVYILNYASKPWAKPYLDLAAKGVLEKTPEDILYYASYASKSWYNASKPWAKPYLDLAAKVVAEKNPEYILNYASEPWVKPYLDLAAKGVLEKNPAYILRYASEPWVKPYLDLAAKVVAEKDPISFLIEYSREEWAAPHIIDLVIKEDPESFLKNYSEEDWSREQRTFLRGKSYNDLAIKLLKDEEENEQYDKYFRIGKMGEKRSDLAEIKINILKSALSKIGINISLDLIKL